MMRAARKDSNHAEIVGYFRKFGCAVADVSQIKNMCDLFVSKNYKTVAVEIKDGAKAASAQALTEGEEKFAASWKGVYVIVTDLSDVIAVVKGLEK